MKTLLTTLLLVSSLAHAERFVVESKWPLSAKAMKRKDFKIENFYPTKHKYFSRLYSVSGDVSEESLRKLSWVKTVEVPGEIQRMVVEPAVPSKYLIPDELFSYQWGLFNQGQTYLGEKDDIHLLPVIGKSGHDIGWDALLPIMPKSRSVVAVLDSGVLLTHPELQDNLWRNEKECGKDPKIDNDGNKLAGDCQGWNFTEPMDSEAAKNPNDIDGHGTHVAGIIGAGQNGFGTVGVFPNSLIMPIKVLKDINSTSDVPSSESFARGIIYAVENGATVINMSLGWPRSLETKFLREAVNFALSQGVAVVAAAGNNNSSEPLFPCAYEGVICVAASTLDGNYAGFSNYGGHVDTVAPGEGILSTYLMDYQPDFFALPNYEVMSGTSQATPFVSGLVAALRSLKPNMKIDEIFARLYQASAPSSSKYILGGVASWDTVSKDIVGSVIKPILKRVRQVYLRGLESRINIPIRNFGLKSGEFTVSLESLSPGLEVLTGEIPVRPLEQGQGAELPFDLRVTDLNQESNISLKVIIKEGDKTHSYVNEIPVVRDIRNEKNFKRLSFVFNNQPLPVAGVKNGEIQNYLSTVVSYSRTPRHDFFMRRQVSEGDKKGMELTFFYRDATKVQEAPKPVFVANSTNLVNLIRVDLNRDGEEDFFVHTLAEENEKKYFVFSFYNQKMESLWPEFQDVKLEIENNFKIASLNSLSFVKFSDPKLGEILVPAFYTKGQIPKEDQTLTSWGRLDTSIAARLYYLRPENNAFKIRALTHNNWVKNLKDKLKSKWSDSVGIEHILPVTRSDLAQGQVRVLVSVGSESKKQLFIHAFDASSTTQGNKLPQLMINSETVGLLYTLRPQGLSQEGDVFITFYDRQRAKLVTTKQLSQESELNFLHQTETDVLAGHLVSFETEKGRMSILQSREELIVINKGQVNKTTKRKKLRYSFLTKKLLSELYYFASYNRDGKQVPALYVDATALTGNRVYLFEEQKGELVSSIRNSLSIPNGCRSMNPSYSEEKQTHEFTFLCLEENNWYLRSFEMN